MCVCVWEGECMCGHGHSLYRFFLAALHEVDGKHDPEKLGVLPRLLVSDERCEGSKVVLQ